MTKGNASPPVLDYGTNSKKRGGFRLYFGIGLCAAIVANLVPYFLTYRAWGTDRIERIGFPFTFRSQGGYVYEYEFSVVALAADVALALAIGLGAGFAWRCWARRKAPKTKNEHE